MGSFIFFVKTNSVDLIGCQRRGNDIVRGKIMDPKESEMATNSMQCSRGM